jgi:hypothetical protein
MRLLGKVISSPFLINNRDHAIRVAFSIKSVKLDKERFMFTIVSLNKTCYQNSIR